MKFGGIGLIGLMAMCLGACATPEPFVQAGITKANSAHIITETDHSDKWSPQISIDVVDGKLTHPVIGSSEEAVVAAGPHVFSFRYSYRAVKAIVALRLNALAGHEYIVHYSRDGGMVRMWLTDGWKGPMVGEIID